MRFLKLLVVIGLTFPLSILAADIHDLQSGKAANFDRADRVLIAMNFIEIFNALDMAIPSLTPSEKIWLDNELEAINQIEDSEAKINRFHDIYRSAEYQQAKIKSHISSIKNSFDCVIQEGLEVEGEIYCWALAGLQLTDKIVFDDSIAILKQKGKLFESEGLLLGGESLGGGYLYNSFGRDIQKNFVLPYLGEALN